MLNNLGNIYRSRSRFADAAHLYELALEGNARYGDPPAAQAPTRVNLALCWLAMNRPDLAEGQARTVLSSLPDYAPAREILRRAESAPPAEGSRGAAAPPP
jgi:tetratricopeptide (TPR) repeat protein